MEEQRNLSATAARPLHLATLSRQNNSNLGRDLGCLDSVDGHHLFVATRAPISIVRTRAFVLGVAPDIHDESLRRESGGRRAHRARDGETVAAPNAFGV